MTTETQETLSKNKSVPNPLIKVNSSELIASSEDSSSFQVSISSHVSTPFDSILLAQAQDLRADVDNIKLNICTHMKVDTDKFALVTPQGIKQCNSLNKFTLATGLLALLNHSEKLCATVSGSRLVDVPASLPPISPNPKSVEENLQYIRRSIVELKDDKKHEVMFRSIEEKLEDLKVSLTRFNKRCGSDHASTPDFLSVPVPPLAFNISSANRQAIEEHEVESTRHTVEHIDDYQEEFIDSSLSMKLRQCFEENTAKFQQNTESGHEVLSFGQPYQYPGAKASVPTAPEFPEPIAAVVAKLKEKFPDSVVNQCLVNKYQDEKAFLPEHSDNETCIVHGSQIFTLSLGGERDVNFRLKTDPSVQRTQTVINNSLYVMSKQSQHAWTHRIDPTEDSRELRYSLTFRYVSKNTNNTTIIIGDSNTRYLKFGSGKGTFGDKLPGKRVLSYKIEDINPDLCKGFKNVFVHCGINNIKQHNVDVQNCANQLIRKLDEICRLSPSSRVTVSPILPTKAQYLNDRAKLFNQFLFDYINNYNPKVGCLDFNCFLDENELLSKQFGRFRDPSDPIHLGSSGIFTLSRLISEKVHSNPTDGRHFSHVLAGKVTIPRNRNLSHHD